MILGPVTFLLLAKPAPGVAPAFDPLAAAGPACCPLYAELLADAARGRRASGSSWTNPHWCWTNPAEVLAAVEPGLPEPGRRRRPAEDPGRVLLRPARRRAAGAGRRPPSTGWRWTSPDRRPRTCASLAALGGLPGKRLVAGVVDGRNIWRTDLTAALTTLGTLLGLADRVDVAASCSLLHVPLDVDRRADVGSAGRPLARLRPAEARRDRHRSARGLSEGRDAIAGELPRNRSATGLPGASPITRDPAVRARVAAVTDADAPRTAAYAERAVARSGRGSALPLLPTTTIGSFPQTDELRTGPRRPARRPARRGRVRGARCAAEIATVVA